MIKLDSHPAKPFTNRECAKILGATIGGLIDSSGLKNTKDALLWWTEHFDECFTTQKSELL